jgi:hypothetical protein
MPRPKLYENDAARQKAFRERHGLETLTVQLPADVMAGLRAKVQSVQANRDAEMTVSKYVADLIKTQVLRKR